MSKEKKCIHLFYGRCKLQISKTPVDTVYQMAEAKCEGCDKKEIGVASKG